MNQELRQVLYKQHPNFYKSQISGGFVRDIECGDGWFNIVKAFSTKCEELIVAGQAPGLNLSCIKEKFGTMRIHLNYQETEWRPEINIIIQQLVQDSERLSSITCECCGVEGAKLRMRNWHETLCENCNNNGNRGTAYEDV